MRFTSREAKTKKELRERRNEVQRQERRVIQKEESLDKKIENLEKKDETLSRKIKDADDRLAEAESLKRSQLDMLEKISGYSKEQAKEYLLKNLEDDLVHEKAVKVLEYQQRTKDEADTIAREIIGTAIQRCAADHTAETTVSVVALPNDEMKGRIIGREGRNVRTLETITGVDLIIDDTPEAITVSSFDPVRREVARLTLEKLISDGRIHPARIEEMYEKARREVDATIKQTGERALIDAGVNGVHPELVKLLGKLKYRTSYGQNVLNHSLEVSYIAGLMAAELGADASLQREPVFFTISARHSTTRWTARTLSWVLRPRRNTARARASFTPFRLTTATLRQRRLSPASFRPPTPFRFPPRRKTRECSELHQAP